MNCYQTALLHYDPPCAVLPKHFTEVHGAEAFWAIGYYTELAKHFTEVHGAEAGWLALICCQTLKHFTEVHGAEGDWLRPRL